MSDLIWVMIGGGIAMVYLLLVGAAAVYFCTDEEVADKPYFTAIWIWPVGVPYLLIRRWWRRRR